MFKTLFAKQVRTEIVDHLEPVRASFTNVAKDVQRLDAFGRESRVLLERWNQYFLHALLTLEKSGKQLHVTTAQHAQVVPTLNEEVKQLHKAHTSLFGSLQAQQVIVERMAQDVQSLQQGTTQVVTTYNKHIVELFQAIETLKSEFSAMKSDVSTHKSELSKHAETISNQQNHISAHTDHLSKHAQSLQSMSSSQTDRFSQYAERISELSRKYDDVSKVISQPIIQPSAPAVPHFVVQQPAAELMSASSSTLRQLTQTLTTSERSILLILVNTDQKLSYKDIAVNYGRSPSTIKNMIIKLKSKNIPLHEAAGSDGIKRYYLDDNFKKMLATTPRL